MSQKSILLFAFVAISFFSCTFDPEEINIVNIDLSDIDFPSIEITNSEDTIYWRGSKSFSFSIESGFSLYGIQILLDGQIIYEGSYSPSLVFNSADFNSGNHRMIFRTFTKSYSGSIADNLNAEAAIAEYVKVCYIDNRPLLPEISGFTVESEMLQLNWNPYGDLKFDKYQFKWTNGEVFWESFDVNESALSFPGYVGGDIKGTFLLYAKEEVVSLPVSYSDDHDFSIEIDQNATLLTLNPVDYNGIESMQIRFSYSLNGDLKELTLPLEMRDYLAESIDLPIIFPAKPKYQLEVNGEVVVAEKNLTEQQILPVPNRLFLINHEKGDRILSFYKFPTGYRDRDEVLLIDPSNGKVINQLKGNFCLSPDGNILYQWIDDLVLRINPETFDVMEVVHLDEEFDFQGSISKLIVSSNNVLFVLIQNSGPIGSSDYTGYSWDRDNFEMISTSYYNSGNNPDIQTIPSVGSVLTASGSFIINEPANYYSAPYFDPLVFSSQDNLVNEEGPVAPLLSSDTYLEGNGSILNVRDYHEHSIQRTANIGNSIVKIFSNYDDLAALITDTNEGYKLTVISTTTFEILNERIFNDQALDAEMKMYGNTISVRFGTETFKWNINE